MPSKGAQISKKGKSSSKAKSKKDCDDDLLLAVAVAENQGAWAVEKEKVKAGKKAAELAARAKAEKERAEKRVAEVAEARQQESFALLSRLNSPEEKEARSQRAQAVATMAFAERAERMFNLQPVAVEDLAKRIYDLSYEAGMKHRCWVSYVLNNFMQFLVEMKGSDALLCGGEPILAFEVHDLNVDGIHSWNVIQTDKWPLSIDLSLEQYIGDKEYTPVSDKEGFVPVVGTSRLVPVGKDGEVHIGVPAKAHGLLTGRTVVSDGVDKGTRDAYLDFIRNAALSQFAGFDSRQRKTAARLAGTREAEQMCEFQAILEDEFFVTKILTGTE